MVNGDQYKYFLFGNRCEADDKLAADSNSYGLRIAKYFNNAGTIMLLDIRENVIDDTLNSMDAGEESIVGLVTCDGVEFLSSLSAVPSVGTAFIGKTYYDKANEGEEASGSSAGDQETDR